VTTPAAQRACFGSLDVRLVANPEYVDLLPIQFRVWPQPDHPKAPDLELTIVDADEPRASVAGLDDEFALAETAGVDHLTSTISDLVVDRRRVPVRAHLTIWPAAQSPEFVVHYLVVNLRALLRRVGRIQLHGAAATIAGRTVVLLGDKGAGKSTLSLAIGRAGGTVLADDQLILEVKETVDGEDSVRISGVDGGLRLTAQTEHHFFSAPLELEPQDFAGTLKKEVPLRELVRADPGTDAVPSACYFPRVGDRFALVPIGRAVAVQRILDALAPLHRFASAGDQMAFVRAITTFVRTVAVFDLTLGPDLEELDLVVAALADGGR
jgi:hypothetical protein